MKHFTAVILIGLLVALLVPAVSNAQLNVNYATALNSVTYAASESDTSAAIYVGSATKLVLVVAPADSAELDVVVQYKRNGTWTTILTDSCITTSATYEQEYSIIDLDSDLLDGLYFPLRVIITGQATGCGVTTPTVRARFYYRL